MAPDSEAWTVLRLLDWTTEHFTQKGMDSPRLEAQVLLGHTLSCDRTSLYMRFDKPLSSDELAQYRKLIQRRLAGEPTAYLVGIREFWSRSFQVDKRVLVPRPDTETLVEVALDWAAEYGGKDNAIRVLEIATGSGAIAITLAGELPNATVVATDISHDALQVAKCNAELNHLQRSVEFRKGDLTEALGEGERFDLVVANLPYICSGEMASLPKEVRCEPNVALDGGEDGLQLIRQLVHDIPIFMGSGALLALEHGDEQGAAVRDILDRGGAFEAPTTRQDLGKRDRITWACRIGDA